MPFIIAIMKLQFLFIGLFGFAFSWCVAICGWLLLTASEYIPFIFTTIYSIFFVVLFMPILLASGVWKLIEQSWAANPEYILLAYLSFVVLVYINGADYIQKFIENNAVTIKKAKYPKLKYPIKLMMCPLLIFSSMIGFGLAEYTGALDIIYQTGNNFMSSYI